MYYSLVSLPPQMQMHLSSGHSWATDVFKRKIHSLKNVMLQWVTSPLSPPIPLKLSHQSESGISLRTLVFQIQISQAFYFSMWKKAAQCAHSLSTPWPPGTATALFTLRHWRILSQPSTARFGICKHICSHLDVYMWLTIHQPNPWQPYVFTNDSMTTVCVQPMAPWTAQCRGDLVANLLVGLEGTDIW